MRLQGSRVVKKFSPKIGMDKVLIRLTQMRWYVYNRPGTAVEMLKQISDEIEELLHMRIVRNWGALSRKGSVRRSQSLPNFL